jgi:hypothetical protein
MSRLFSFCSGFCAREILIFRENSPNVIFIIIPIYMYKYVIYITHCRHTRAHIRAIRPEQYSSRLPPNARLKTIFYSRHTLL